MSQDNDRRLRNALHGLAEEADTAVSVPYSTVRTRIRLRRRRAIAGATATVVLLVTGIGAAVSVYRDSGNDAQLTIGPSPTPGPTAAYGWSPPFASASIEARSGATALTGNDAMLVWGGDSATGQRADGAIYTPSTDTWRRMAPAPIAGRSQHAAFWDGGRMLVWGGHTDGGTRELNDGAYYAPAEDRWTAVPAAPIAGRRDVAAAFTTVDLYIYGGVSGDGAATQTFADGAAYDSETGRWRLLPPSPLGPRFGAASVLADGTWLIWGGNNGENPSSTGASFDLFGVSQEGWSLMPDLPRSIPAPQRPQAVWTGSDMLIFGAHHTGKIVGAAYTPSTRTWRALASAPFVDWDATSLTWTGDRLLVWSGDALYEYRPGSDSWQSHGPGPLSARSGVAATWNGTRLLLWGGSTQAGFTADGAAFSPTDN